MAKAKKQVEVAEVAILETEHATYYTTQVDRVYMVGNISVNLGIGKSTAAVLDYAIGKNFKYLSRVAKQQAADNE